MISLLNQQEQCVKEKDGNSCSKRTIVSTYVGCKNDILFTVHSGTPIIQTIHCYCILNWHHCFNQCLNVGCKNYISLQCTLEPPQYRHFIEYFMLEEMERFYQTCMLFSAPALTGFCKYVEIDKLEHLPLFDCMLCFSIMYIGVKIR